MLPTRLSIVAVRPAPDYQYSRADVMRRCRWHDLTDTIDTMAASILKVASLQNGNPQALIVNNSTHRARWLSFTVSLNESFPAMTENHLKSRPPR